MVKVAKNYRLEKGTVNVIEALAKKFNFSNTEIIEYAIMALAHKELTQDEVIDLLDVYRTKRGD